MVSIYHKQGKHSARKPPKLIILQMCNKITEPNSFRDLQPLNYGSICPEMGTSKLRNRDPTFMKKGPLAAKIGTQNNIYEIQLVSIGTYDPYQIE